MDLSNMSYDEFLDYIRSEHSDEVLEFVKAAYQLGKQEGYSEDYVDGERNYFDASNLGY
jgi:hypothetical protein